MDTDEHIRSALRERQPAVDVDRALSEVQGRAARARRGRLIGLAAASVAVLAGGAAVVGAVTDDDSSRLESTDPAAPPTVPVAPQPGDVATWTTDPSSPPAPDASSIAVLVTRLRCSGGVTGEVLRPGVVVDGSQVVITFTVKAIGPGAYPCPGNDAVPYEVDLGEPLGDRSLVDGGCTSDGAGGTGLCEFGAVRWPLDDGDLADRGTALGRLTLVGGPAGSEPRGVAGEIDVITPAGEVVDTLTTAADGSFTVTLAPGAYRLEGHTSQYQAGEAACTAEIEILIAELTDVVVACQMK